MAFPLDGAFAELRKVVDEARVAIASLIESAQVASSGLKGLGASATKETQAAGAAAGNAAKSVDKLAASQDKAARSSVRFRDSMRDVSGAASGLQRALASGGTLAKMFGFEEAGRKLENFSRGLGAVKDTVTGIVAAGPALLSTGAIVGVVVAGLAAIQEGVRRGTGETLSLSNTVAGAALTVGQVINESVAGWKLAFNDLSLFVGTTFNTIGQAILAPIRDALISIGLSMQSMGMSLQKSVNPALVATGNTLRDLARGAIEASDSIEGAYSDLGRQTTQAMQEHKVANDAILEEVASAAEGVRIQINKLFDEPDGTGLLDSLKALVAGLNDAKGAAASAGSAGSAGSAERLAQRAVLEGQMDSIRRSFTGAGGGPSGVFGTQARLALWADMGHPDPKDQTDEQKAALDQIEAEGKASHDAWVRAGQTSGVAYTSGLLEEIEKSKSTISTELLQALTVDPNDGKVITSFRDLWENIKNVFRSNPIGVLGGLLGNSGVGGSAGAGGFAAGSNVSGGGGFAQGGEVGARGATPSWAHFARGVRGFARGGLAASDTIAAWLTKGEYVMKLAAVQRYGPDVMAQLNAGRVDPRALRAAAGGGGAPSPSSGPGFASGGLVGGGGGPSVLPVMVTDKAGAEQMAHAGRGAILRLFAEDPDFRGLLGR